MRGMVSGRLIAPLMSAVPLTNPTPDESRDKATVPWGVKPVPDAEIVEPGITVRASTLIDGP